MQFRNSYKYSKQTYTQMNKRVYNFHETMSLYKCSNTKNIHILTVPFIYHRLHEKPDENYSVFSVCIISSVCNTTIHTRYSVHASIGNRVLAIAMCVCAR